MPESTNNLKETGILHSVGHSNRHYHSSRRRRHPQYDNHSSFLKISFNIVVVFVVAVAVTVLFIVVILIIALVIVIVVAC